MIWYFLITVVITILSMIIFANYDNDSRWVDAIYYGTLAIVFGVFWIITVPTGISVLVYVLIKKIFNPPSKTTIR